MVMRLARSVVLIVLMLPATGCLYVWGDAAGTVLGSTGDQPEPALVGDDVWEDVSTGRLQACGIQAGGALFCWGLDGLAPGQADLPPSATPQRVGTGSGWTAITVGFVHACGILDPGELWCWGANWYGQLGSAAVGWPYETTPIRVGDADDWVTVDAGGDSTCGTRADGSLWCWGFNPYGNLGIPVQTTDINVPTRVGVDTGWADVDAGYDRTCGVRAGALLCWGYDQFGFDRGGPYPADVHIPKPVAPGGDWEAVSVGDLHACATTAAGDLSCWGVSDHGALGTGSMAAASALPVPVSAPGLHWTFVDADADTSCGITDGGELHCWGTNANGQLGDGTTTDRPAPTRIGTQSGWTAVELGPSGASYGIRI